MRVKIYQDPITKKDFEGEAEVIRILRPKDVDGMIWAEVRFDGETETYPRWFQCPEKEYQK